MSTTNTATKKLNQTEIALIRGAHDNAHGKGWVRAINERPTTKAAMRSLRERGLIEYATTEAWAGNRLTDAGRAVAKELGR